MKPTETTPDRLVFEDRPTAQLWLAGLATVVFAALAAWLFARGNDAGVIFAVFAVSGPVYVLFFVETRRIVFDRGAGTVTVSRRGLRGREEAAHPLAGIARAEAHRATSDPAARALPLEAPPPAGVPLRAVLVTGDGRVIALEDTYAPGSAAVEMARAVNGWLGR